MNNYKPDPNEGWVGFDFDGTLVKHAYPSIGEVIPSMLIRLKSYLNRGIRVKIMTARASDSNQIPILQAWCKSVGLPKLEVTNQKDYLMIRLYDDRARQVLTDTGIVVGE